MNNDNLKGCPSLDKPWQKYYSNEEISASLPECTLFDALYKNNRNFPSSIALNYYGQKITFGTMFNEIQKTANAFYSLGVRTGDVVVICSVNIPETIYSFYALNRLGAIANMIDPRTSVSGVHDYITESSAKTVLTVDIAYPLIEKATEGTCVENIITISPADSLPYPAKLLYTLKNKRPRPAEKVVNWNQFISQGLTVKAKYAQYNKDTCCVIAHTGGTTGVPKSVMLSNDNINAVMHGYRFLGIPFKRGHRYFNDLPPFIMYGLCLATHTTLCYGLEVILYPIFDSKGFPKQFVKYKPHHFSALPDHLKYLIESRESKDMDLSYFITAAVGGDSLNRDLEKACNKHFMEHNCHYPVVKGYGMTELSATAVTSCPKANAIGSVGIPLVMNTIKIVDLNSGCELPYDKTGEIWISGPSIMLGYYHNPLETEKMIVSDADGKRWIKTGDLGYITKEGLLFHEGRIRRIYLTSFEGQPAKIFPMLVEEKLKSHTSVYDCTVVARLKPNSANYEAIAFVILKDNTSPSAALNDAFNQICESELPSYMWPVEYRFVTEFPHTPIGKVDYRKLEAQLI